ncbi:MAG: hypothetical protein CFE21_16125 [Bacteroidetes bacterium B1(2017)]|nr:MAG: hypothetical protein CFE21_16125 [Bacteroidetes bacterium B1(2017)]
MVMLLIVGKIKNVYLITKAMPEKLISSLGFGSNQQKKTLAEESTRVFKYNCQLLEASRQKPI